MSDTLEALQALGSATVHEAQGKTGALSSAIKPLDAASKICGPAVTVRTRPGDNLALHLAVLECRPGDVLVVDAFGYVEAGAWGDILTHAAQYRGIAGLVINGAVRDVDPIKNLGFPVFAKATSIKGTAKADPGTIGQTISIDGVEINTGDIVVADCDGVVIVPADTEEEARRKAQEREDTEAQYIEQIKAGITTMALYSLQ
ncbi:4-carboxy-4-hydroxy-2-oxoadipate aldolase/oxaloacetate decarboxylase [Arthrobacter pigmenti]